jgi:2-haloalkanoic acid dehalogenase type II
MMTDAYRPRVITFDCYGTLVQWHEVLWAALASILTRKCHYNDIHRAITFFHEARHALTHGPYRTYKDILTQALHFTLANYGAIATADDVEELLCAIRTCPPFHEVRGTLDALRKRYEIAIISNSDSDLIADSIMAIGVEFDYVVVAEQCRSYKPSHTIFNHALRTVGTAAKNVLHVGASIEIDIAPAAALGISGVLVNRRGLPVDRREAPIVVPDMSKLLGILHIKES